MTFFFRKLLISMHAPFVSTPANQRPSTITLLRLFSKKEKERQSIVNNRFKEIRRVGKVSLSILGIVSSCLLVDMTEKTPPRYSRELSMTLREAGDWDK